MSLNPQNTTPPPSFFFFFLSCTFQRFKHAHTNGHGTWITDTVKRWGGLAGPTQSTHESLVCCFRCACKLPELARGLRNTFLLSLRLMLPAYINASTVLVFGFACNKLTWEMLQPSRPAGTFKLKVYYVCSYLPSLAGYVQRSPLFLSRSFLSLSLFHSLILFASFQRKQGPFYCPSLFRSSNTHTKKESLILLLLLFLFPLPKIFCTFGVCSVYPSVCPTFCLPLPLIQLRKREKWILILVYSPRRHFNLPEKWNTVGEEISIEKEMI